MNEIRRIITDQINRHVAMQDTYRVWLANDIATRVEAEVEKLRVLLRIAANNIHDEMDGEESLTLRINAALDASFKANSKQ